MENPPKPEDILEAYRRRTKSDAAAIRGGAEYGFTKDNPDPMVDTPRLEFESHDVAKVHLEMTDDEERRMQQEHRELVHRRAELQRMLQQEPVPVGQLATLLNLHFEVGQELKVIAVAQEKVAELRSQIRALSIKRVEIYEDHEAFEKRIKGIE